MDWLDYVSPVDKSPWPAFDPTPMTLRPYLGRKVTDELKAELATRFPTAFFSFDNTNNGRGNRYRYDVLVNSEGVVTCIGIHVKFEDT